MARYEKCGNGRIIEGRCVRTYSSYDEMSNDEVFTKGDYGKKHLKGITNDTALPQDWLDWVVKRNNLDYDKVSGSTFWIYPRGNVMGQPFSMLDELNDVRW